MFATRFLTAGLSLIVIACTALVADAQTGPITGGSPKGKQTAGAAQGLTAERVAAMLNSKVDTQSNGDKAVSAILEKDGWKFEVIVYFFAGKNVFDIISPLSAPNAQFTQAQVQGMSQKNNEWKAAQKFFSINEQDKRLYLEDINFQTTISEQEFVNSVNSFMATIRSTHDLWKSN